MTIGILTTNYNTWAMSSQCIHNCLKFADVKINRFIVVDDCSTEEISNGFQGVEVLKNPVNMGLTKSLNRGLQKLDTDLVIIFDSDAWPLEPYIKDTISYFENNPKVGIAAYQTVNDTGDKAASFEPEPDAVSLILGQKLHTYYQKAFSNNLKDITLYTCAMVIRKKVIEEIGGFDENYDWLELDHDICMAATRKGWDMGIIPVLAYHKGSGTAQKVSKRVIRFYKNRMMLLRKFHKYPAPILLNTLISGRLMIEYLLINTVGRVKMTKEIRQDKSHSRSELIKLFLTGRI